MDSTLLESRQLDALFDAVLAQRVAAAHYRGSSPLSTHPGDDVDLYGTHGLSDDLYGNTNSAERGGEWGMHGIHQKPSAFWKGGGGTVSYDHIDTCLHRVFVISLHLIRCVGEGPRAGVRRVRHLHGLQRWWLTCLRSPELLPCVPSTMCRQF